ncbi:hypothetical protein [Escherichia coli]|uniref:hypothetical protein n=1 Tax=Escherichia coli TaxID=562 RepID=UPI00183AAE3C|nr:hypothetical protein [Escherichia coli]EFA8838455.1 hypothetical protein [Escherichia coli O88:H4]
MSGNNVFDGLFASPERDIAASHGNTVFIYHVDDDKIAKSRDLDARFQEVYAFLHNELDTADVEEIADRVMQSCGITIQISRILQIFSRHASAAILVEHTHGNCNACVVV